MNRYLIITMLTMIGMSASAQIHVPRNFYLVKEGGLSGRDYYYTDGQYRLSEGTPFQADNPTKDEEKMNLFTTLYGVSFNKTREGLFVGTGYHNNVYKYIVVARRFSYILTGKINNQGFSEYSKWMFNQIRYCLIEGDRQIYFK